MPAAATTAAAGAFFVLAEPDRDQRLRPARFWQNEARSKIARISTTADPIPGRNPGRECRVSPWGGLPPTRGADAVLTGLAERCRPSAQTLSHHHRGPDAGCRRR